jgi:hypothetical protein
MLSEQARLLLLVRCANHTVAHCDRCDRAWFLEELREEAVRSGGQGVRCQICSTDLTPSIQRHVFGCLLAWVHEGQLRAQVMQNDSREDAAATTRAHGGARHWLVPAAVGAGGAALVLSGVIVWCAGRAPLFHAAGAVGSPFADAPTSTSRSWSAPPRETQAAESPDSIGTVAMSAARDVAPSPTPRDGTVRRDTAPYALARAHTDNRARPTSPLDTMKTRVGREWDTARTQARKMVAAVEPGVSRPDKRPAIATLRNRSVARTLSERMQSP